MLACPEWPRPTKRSLPRTRTAEIHDSRSTPFLCLKGPGPWRRAADDRKIAWSHTGADNRQVRTPRPRHREGIRSPYRRQHRQRPGRCIALHLCAFSLYRTICASLARRRQRPSSTAFPRPTISWAVLRARQPRDTPPRPTNLRTPRAPRWRQHRHPYGANQPAYSIIWHFFASQALAFGVRFAMIRKLPDHTQAQAAASRACLNRNSISTATAQVTGSIRKSRFNIEDKCNKRLRQVFRQVKDNFGGSGLGRRNT